MSRIYSTTSNRELYYGNYPSHVYQEPGLTLRNLYFFYEPSKLTTTKNIDKIVDSKNDNDVVKPNLKQALEKAQPEIENEAIEPIKNEIDSISKEENETKKSSFKVVKL